MFEPSSACCSTWLNRWLTMLFLLFIALVSATSATALSIGRGPYLQQPTDNSIIVRWRTDSNSVGEVRYGGSPTTLSLAETGSASTTEHVIQLNGLAADTRYYYSVGTATETLAGANTDHYFETAPATGFAQPTRLWVLGDSGTANDNARAVRDAYLGHIGSNKADMLLMLGDNAYNDGTDSEYQSAFFNIYPGVLRNTPTWSALGNHDGHNADSSTESGPYYDIFSFPRTGEAGGVASGTEAYYSFNYGNIHFISLDSYDTNRSQTGAMATWLQQDLSNTLQDWIIAFWHHPPYTKGSHNSDTEARLIDMRTNFLPILENYGVDLVLSGHSHSYERSYFLDSHYGSSGSILNSMILDDGDGSDAGTGAYTKLANMPHDGAVYVVAGSSGKVGGGSLNHPAMFRNLSNLGSMVIDINGNRLDAVFLRENGSTPDTFTIIKGSDTTPPSLSLANALDSTTLDIVFSENVEQASAENLANYSIDGGISITNAVLQNDGRTARLTTSLLTLNQVYTVTAYNIEDIYANQMVTDQATFQWVTIQTAAFQNGGSPDAGYNGVIDAYIAEGYPDANYGGATVLLLDGDDGGGNDLSSLIRWDITFVPAGSIIDSASITIQAFNPSPSSYEMYALKRAWSDFQVTWNQADNTNNWQSSGADGANDREIQILGTVNANSTGLQTITLNGAGLAAIQQWINDPGTNHGIIISNSSNLDGVDFYSSEYGTQGSRPKLSLSYHAGIVDSVPPSIPANLEVIGATTSSISLSWDASTDNVAVQNYQIYRDGTQVDTATGTSYTDIGLAAGTPYNYQVSAIDTSANESGLSESVDASTNPVAVDTISVLEATYKANRDELKVRAASSEQPVAILSVYGPGPDNNSLGDMTWKKGNYELKLKPTPDPTPWEVTIISNFGGMITANVTGATPPGPPGSASNPSPSDGASNVSINAQLAWNAAPGADGYNVYFGPTAETLDSKGQITATTFNPGLLALDSDYAWRIDAVNNTGTTTGETWNFQTQSSTPPPVDTITISRAEWSAKRQELKVEATSSAQPGAVLTLESLDTMFGTMTFRNSKYTYKKKPVTYPNGGITVNSSFGGTANVATVQVSR